MATHSNIKVILVAALMTFLGAICAEKVMSGTYTDTKHGNSSTGVNRFAVTDSAYPDATNTYAPGHCGHCHEQHASVRGAEPAPTGDNENPYALFKENYGSSPAYKNELCYACHETFTLGSMPIKYGRHGIYQGAARYTNSIHNTAGTMIWPGASPPGPAYTDYGNCNNCHNPHGYNDGSGVIPYMLFQRDGQSSNEMGCEACHDSDGPASTDIQSVLINKTYKHPTHTYNDRHAADESGPGGFGVANRHAECVDCHNPHTIRGIVDTTPTVHPSGGTTPDRTSNGNSIYDTTLGSGALQGVWGVDVTPSYLDTLEPWQRPIDFWYELRPPTYPDGAEKEYQICFKCHSWYGEHGGGDSFNIARDFSPKNLSAHPIMRLLNDQTGSVEVPGDPGRKGLEKAQMWNPWKTNIGEQTMYCSDCHGSNAGTDPAGVHGSDQSKMLRSWDPTKENIYWPNNQYGNPWLLLDVAESEHDWQNKLFCAGCHPIYNPKTDTWKNSTHSATSYHGSSFCTDCHVRRVHGSDMDRLLLPDWRSQINWQGNPQNGKIEVVTKRARNSYSSFDCDATCGSSPH